MSLLRNYDGLSAERTNDRCDTVVTALKDNPNFEAIKDDVTLLETLGTTLSGTIIQRNMRTHTTNVAMMNAKADVVAQMDVVRSKANSICNGDLNLERETGFTPSKKGRTPRKSIDAAVITGVKTTTAKGQLEIIIRETISGNQGFEVHYILDGKDTIAGTWKLKRGDRERKVLALGLPSLKQVEVYMITLSTNNVRSLPSNSMPGAAL